MGAPFWRIPDAPASRAILLVHGFLTSPYLMHSLAERFAAAGYLVYGLLFPGHAATPEDLNTVQAADYTACVEQAYAMLAAHPGIREVIPVGFSLGATLSALLSLTHQLPKAVLIAPAFKISSFARLLPWICRLGLDHVLPDLRCTQSERVNLVSYTRFSMKSVVEIQKIIDLYPRTLQAIQHRPQIYCAASTEDNTVAFAGIQATLKNYPAGSHLRCYSQHPGHVSPPAHWSHQDIDMSQYPHIDAMSHVALPVAPSDPYLGHAGEYYAGLPPTTRFGEPHHAKFSKIKRLTYNPDFENFSTDLIQWLKK